MLTNQLRIVGGRWRGRQLRFGNEPGLRPTSDRLRETLFNWLRPVIQGAECLDAFAGSGALGFEAISQQASSVVMLERARKVAAQLEKNIELLQTSQIQLIQTDTLQYLSQIKKQFDVIFLDPPFQSPLLEKSLSLITKHHLLKPDGQLYLERDKTSDLPFDNTIWRVEKEKIMGRVKAQLLSVSH